MTTRAVHLNALRIQAEKVWLDALLACVETPRGLIVLAVPYVLSLKDSRDAYVAAMLREAGFSTLQICMLTAYEETRDPDLRYDITLFDQRLRAALLWASQQPALGALPVGLLTTDTVSAAAIRLLSRSPEAAGALVCRSGRPELAGASPLRTLHTPILLQVPGADAERLTASLQAQALISAPHQWHEYALASAGFMEPGTLDAAARETCAWFSGQLPDARPDDSA